MKNSVAPLGYHIIAPDVIDYIGLFYHNAGIISTYIMVQSLFTQTKKPTAFRNRLSVARCKGLEPLTS